MGIMTREHTKKARNPGSARLRAFWYSTYGLVNLCIVCINTTLLD